MESKHLRYMRDAIYASEAIDQSIQALLEDGEQIDVGHWQGFETAGRPDLMTKELLNLHFTCQITPDQDSWQMQCMPNMPWAEREFLERVGRTPRNPHQSLELWPHWHEQTEATMHNGMFSHTYSERFWPKQAGDDRVERVGSETMYGIRYKYGDLDDVVDLLRRHPHTRQATFPIFFPEDTGAVHGGRIPCTLHYHFLLRGMRLNLFYPIRSCDAYRHFRDDVYMAGRLCQWVIDQLRDNDYGSQDLWENVRPGVLCFTAYSFHVHMGDLHHLSHER
jgi:hypothetical protein